MEIAESIDFLGYFVVCVDVKPIKLIGYSELGMWFDARNYFVSFLVSLE